MRSEQNEPSIKSLLKQVYNAHATKVKSLEDEILTLKSKLIETEKYSILNFKMSQEKHLKGYKCENCKVELNNKTCDIKKELENNACKLSVFSNSDSKVHNNGEADIDSLLSTEQCESSYSDKPHITKEFFLKNLMKTNSLNSENSSCVSETLSNFGNEYSTLNVDSVILAPDTAGMEQIIKISNKDEVSGNSMIGNKNKCSEIKSPKSRPDVCEKEVKMSRLTKKRPLAESDILNIDAKKTCSGNLSTFLPEKDTKNRKSKKKIAEISENEVLKVSKKIMPNRKMEKNQCPKEHERDCLQDVIPEEFWEKTVHNSEADNYSVKSKDNTFVENTSLKESIHEVSPSLLPVINKDENNLLQNVQCAEDNDFETPKGIKKKPDNKAGWIACDKKKVKKVLNTQTVKSTSRFKMTLDSLPLNYKKPTYKQTKLTKSIFLPKVSSNDTASSIDKDSSLSKGASQVLERKSEKCSLIDFDATCIPENYKNKNSYSQENVQKISLVKEIDEIMLLDLQDSDESCCDLPSKSLDEEHKRIGNEKKIKSKDVKASDNFKIKTESKEKALSSFDRLPRKEEPSYKYKEDTVRKKNERLQLNGFDCKECEKYYQELGLTDQEKQERMKKCSRHRGKFAPPATPENFWEIDFPDTMECRARGYMNETQKVKLKSHRRRP